MNKSQEVNVKSAPANNDSVDLEIALGSEPPAQFNLSSDLSVGLAASLLGSARAAGEASAPPQRSAVGDQLGRTFVVDPNSIGISQSGDGKTTALIMMFGSTRLGVRLWPEQTADLAKTLSQLAGEKAV